jgi:hypothetical protein
VSWKQTIAEGSCCQGGSSSTSCQGERPHGLAVKQRAAGCGCGAGAVDLMTGLGEGPRIGSVRTTIIGQPPDCARSPGRVQVDRMSIVRLAWEEGAIPWRGFQDNRSAPVLTEHVVMGAFVVSWRLVSAEDGSRSI